MSDTEKQSLIEKMARDVERAKALLCPKCESGWLMSLATHDKRTFTIYIDKGLHTYNYEQYAHGEPRLAWHLECPECGHNGMQDVPEWLWTELADIAETEHNRREADRRKDW